MIMSKKFFYFSRFAWRGAVLIFSETTHEEEEEFSQKKMKKEEDMDRTN